MVLISSGRIEMSGFLLATGYKFHSIAKTIPHDATKITYYNGKRTPNAHITKYHYFIPVYMVSNLFYCFCHRFLGYRLHVNEGNFVVEEFCFNTQLLSYI